ncbi:hypothetical protein GCM10017709_00490 [Glutamicibacter nicotianae]|uniref:Uncharacterized protein n=1 Tax=Glutamicibacter nicotianae TaxID=37929 RepID=A0ABQ0RNV8_GLUNI|nr:hypothetical protein ANI01nite_26930 [Glutamicibacter nicotianae]
MSRLISVLRMVEGEEARAARIRYRLVSDFDAGTCTVASRPVAAKGAAHQFSSASCSWLGRLPGALAVLIGRSFGSMLHFGGAGSA